MTDLHALYRTDYDAWAKRHVELLRNRQFNDMDIEHLLEELSDMSKSERRELESRLLILIAHLLKPASLRPYSNSPRCWPSMAHR